MFQLAILQIININTQQDTLSLSGYLNLYWTDANLNWNPKDYNGITYIRLPVAMIWTPDIFLYTAADASSWNQLDVSGVLARIRYDGYVFYCPPSFLTSSCIMNIADFPFDSQTCNLKYSSWMYDQRAINFLPLANQPDLNSYIVSEEWNIDSALQISENVTYNGNSRVYPAVIVRLVLRRRSMFYIVNFVFPCFILSLLCLFGYMLPVESGQKIPVELTTLVMIVYFSQNIFSVVPASSKAIPRIVFYYGSISILALISTLGTSFISFIYYIDCRLYPQMPKWFEKLVLNYLARIFQMKQPTALSAFTKTEIYDLDTTSNNTTDATNKELRYTLKKILDYLVILKETHEKNEENELILLKWKFASLVLDRFFFCLTLTYIIISFVCIIMTSSGFYKLQ